jgi:diaminohydroxyphosphoribosylaminopyrimidine deaminase/5-amino-6-(5-phosphoribosylamino)uracil reductase
MSYFVSNGPSLKAIRKGCKTALDESEKNSDLPEIVSGLHPKVGCVILDRSGKIITKAYTREKGELHAEVIAIEKMKEKNKQGHTLITTLEPCSFRDPEKHGEELPCAKKIVRAGIKQVVIGSLDSNIGVKGRGVYILSTRKVYCTMFPHDLYLEVLKSNEKYIKMHENRIPYLYYFDIDEQQRLPPIEHEFDLNWHSEIDKFLSSKLYEEIKKYSKEWQDSPDTLPMNIPFDAYLYVNRRSEIINTLDERMRQLIIDYLAVPPDEPRENEDYYIICGISRWYIIKEYKTMKKLKKKARI